MIAAPLAGWLVTLLAMQAPTVAAVDEAPDPVPAAIVAFAKEHVGKTVGRGECSDLAAAALEAADAAPWKLEAGAPVWGEAIEKRSELRPGDVIQFRDAVFSGRRRTAGGFATYRADFPYHTAIIEKVLDGGRRLAILHQNAGPADAPEDERRAVRRDMLILSDLQPGGTLGFYRPRRAEGADNDAPGATTGSVPR